MHSLTIMSLAALALAAPAASTPSTPSEGGIGDLLVAPTRLVLDGRKGAEVILNNIGSDPATYRVSVEFRRMTEDGGLEDVAEPDARHRMAEEMIVYAPRRVTLAPREPQSIRIAARPGANIPDGEYRVHLLFRAIPPAMPVVAAGEQPKGISFALIPVYGVTIPVIVRLGNLQVKAAISDVRLDTAKDGKRSVALELSRSGERSTFGEVRVFKPGVKDPIAVQRAVAVYTEIGRRKVVVPVSDAFTGDVRGPVTVQYVETFDDGSHTLAEAQAVLR